ncbi:MAG: hypothetical protein ACE5JO_04780, partial [Candidatus Binatia bacterium]
AIIPPMSVPEKFREIVTTAHIMEPVSAIADGVERSKNGEGELRSDWPPDLVLYMATQKGIYRDMQCVKAWRLIPPGALAAILDTVRTRILSFALEIEAEAPDAGEAPPDHLPVPQERVTQIFHTQISGGVGNVAIGSHDVTQVSVIQVQEGDFNSLRRYLGGLHVADVDLEELETALLEDAVGGAEGRIGNQTSGWIGRMIGKASSGAWEVGVSVAGSILTRAISQYLGLPF